MTKTVEQAKADLASANEAYRSELQAYSNRGEGSGAQERRREEHLQELRSKVAECERALAEAERRHQQEQSEARE